MIRILTAIFAFMLLTMAEGCLPAKSILVVKQISNAENTAVLSKRDSGAPSKGSTLVSVRLNSVPDNATHGAIVLGLVGDQMVEMKWISGRHLAVSCRSCTPDDVNYEVTKDGDVVVTYDSNIAIP